MNGLTRIEPDKAREQTWDLIRARITSGRSDRLEFTLEDIRFGNETFNRLIGVVPESEVENAAGN